MKMVFQSLVLRCRRSNEVVEFSPQLSFFHGQLGAGKSSIARLIDYCLGASLQPTPAISKELVSVELRATFGRWEVLLERKRPPAGQVQVSFRNETQEYTVLAPIDPADEPIISNDVFNLSDLLYRLSGQSPVKVRKSKLESDTEYVRLSFRDVMWYCYLEQSQLDSSFYRLEDDYRKLKSRDVMRFVLGYYNERILELEQSIEQTRIDKAAKIEAASQMERIVADINNSDKSISDELADVERVVLATRNELKELSERHSAETHISEPLRRELRTLGTTLAHEEEAHDDLEQRIREQEGLKAELISAKFKVDRTQAATMVLSGVSFDACPECGSHINRGSVDTQDRCVLCHSSIREDAETASTRDEVLRNDLMARVEDLSESITQHRRALKRQVALVQRLRLEKRQLDDRLEQVLADYDSAYTSTAREMERRLATYDERMKHLSHLKSIEKQARQLREDAGAMQSRETALSLDLKKEYANLKDAGRAKAELESTYLEALLAVGVPGVSEGDHVEIDIRNWKPAIHPADPDSPAWDFYSAGSGGKATLLNVCYALALHLVAVRNDLPLPTFLIIDTPMKNIGEDVNRDIFVSFYQYLYQLASTSLSGTQIIIIDKEFIATELANLVLVERYMTPDDDRYPPLISYHRGA